MPERDNILPGTLDLLILKALSLGPQHGYGVLLRIEQITGQAVLIEQGALYPGLYRLEHQGAVTAEWGVSDNNRRAKFYRLTPAGRRRLKEEMSTWSRMVSVMSAALQAKPEEV
jgi:PadR family transcriptional regulator PadR